MRKIEIIQGDCMEVMAQYPDKYFDLAVVDPPYGIGIMKTKNGNLGIRKEIKGSIDDNHKWDFYSPGYKYFKLLQKVSKNQIIWGGNYFIDYLHKTNCFIVWDKNNGESYYADCELAWTSFGTATRKFKYASQKQGRIHICQKPVALYDWIYQKYLPKGGKVLDTHGGSMSNVISWIKAGNIDGVCTEKDVYHFNDAKKRIQVYLAQQDMFREPIDVKFVQPELIISK